MCAFFPAKFDDDHRKLMEDFREDYEKLSKKIEKLLPKSSERKQAYDRLIESFCWMGRTLRSSQFRQIEEAKKAEKNAAKELAEVSNPKPAALSTSKRVVILRKK